MKKIDFIKECATLDIEKALAEKLFVKSNGNFETVINLVSNADDIESVLIDWLNEPEVSESVELAAEGTVINAAPDVETAIVKIISVKFQPSYGGVGSKVDSNGVVEDRPVVYGKSHFDIRGIGKTGKPFSVVAGYALIVREIGDLFDSSSPVESIRTALLGKFVILDYQHIVQGMRYQKRDDSDSKGTMITTAAKRTANHLVSVSFDESGEFEKQHELATARQIARDDHSVEVDKAEAMSHVKISRAQAFLAQMTQAHADGLEFDTVALLKELIA